MNTNSSTSTSSVATRSPRDRAGRTDPHTMRREGDRFERLLRDKSAARQEDDDAEPCPVAPECPGVVPLTPLASPLQGHAVVAALARAGAAAHDTASPTQAALGSAMAAQQPLQAPGQSDAHTFQVSINEPMGLPLELRAVRVPAASQAQAPALWALNIAAPSREAGLLARHGSRLDERLRARGIDPSQVHVESDAGDDDAAH